MNTAMTELFGIEKPIMCGGMFYFSEPKLCAAISNAGGLGDITSGSYDDPEDLRAAIKECKQLTDKPFAVNITQLPSRMTQEQYDAYYRVCFEEGVAAIEASGYPADRYVEAAHAAGIKIMQKVGSVRHALHAQKAGMDAVIAAGFEEGGHPLDDDVTTMVLIPKVSDALSIPVIAAGGIADGRGLAAAIALGADGVMMATRFMLTQESRMHDAIKRDMIEKQENEVDIIKKTVPPQGRVLITPLTKKVQEIEAAGGGLEGIRELITGRRIPTANEAGDIDGAAWYIGQSIGLIKDIPTCQELLDTMIADAEKRLNLA